MPAGAERHRHRHVLGRHLRAEATTALADAEEALRLAQSDPNQSRALALEALKRDPDPLATATAERALGMAAKACNDWLLARRHLERSVAISAALAPVVSAETRASLAPVLWYLGDTSGALRQIDLATPHLNGPVAARLEMNRAFIMQREGRLDEALEVYRRALAAMRRLGDVVDEASLLTNRSILHAYRGELAAAEADLLLAERLHAQLGQKLQAADVRHNLGFLAARRGDIPTALERYDAADRERAALGVATPPQALLDRCEALLSVRLVAEARRVGQVAAERLAAAGLDPELAEVHLLLAQAALLAGDTAEARRTAQLARLSFERQRRLGWLALADYTCLRADHLDRPLDPELRPAALRTATELVDAGWVTQALDSRIMAAQAALARGAVEEATDDLRESAAALRWGHAELRARAWYAQALLRHARHDRRGTQSALLAGMRALRDGRALLGATELRVFAAAQGKDLADFGIRLALESRRAERVLSWTERCRAATATQRRPPRPPSDSEVASCLTRLRFTVSQVEEAALSGGDTKRLLRQQAALEAEIRQKTRHARGEVSEGAGPPSISRLRGALGDAVLVEMVESDETLFAVVLSGERVRLCPLGPTGPVTAKTLTLRFALARMANRRLSAASSEAALLLARQTAAELDGMLLLPLRRHIGDRSLVVAPTGILHALPWMALPSCVGRAVTVCPSAGLWLRGTALTAPAERPRRILLVAGPGLTHARAEVEELSRVYPGAATLVGSQATTARFARAATGADLVHVAAHGSYRDDNPLLSSMRLADGPITVYDFELLRSPPRCLILSACEGGLSEVHPGEELMGLSAGLLGSGAKVLVASVTTARDATSRSLMVAFHRLLSSGVSPAQALADAQEGLRRHDPEEAFGAAGFVCFGAGLDAV